MKTKQYQGRTREQAIEEARRELGDNMVIMHTKRKFGLFGSTYLVTAGVEDDAPLPNYKEVFESAEQTQSQVQPATFRRFDAVADEEVKVPVIQNASPIEQSPSMVSEPVTSTPTKEGEVLVSEDIRSAFRAVGQVIAQSEHRDPPIETGTYDKRASLVHYQDVSASNEYTRDRQPVNRPKRQFVPLSEESSSSVKDEFSIEDASGKTVDFGERMDQSRSKIIRAIYKVLLDHEVDERYINQVMAELDLRLLQDASIETALGLVYQKLVLKFGRPRLISFEEKKPKVVFFIGPTGVGKTTTIAKLATDFRFNQKKKVVLFTADTYRIAAERQLSEYGNLMNIDVVVLFVEGKDKDDINKKIAEKYSRYDLILVDTTGFSHHDAEQRDSIHYLLDSLSDKYDKQVYLVLSATTKYRDLKEIVDVYKGFTDFDLLFTKLDETEVYGNIFNIKIYADVPLSYVTTGQVVPDDLEVIDPQKMVHSLLGGG